LSAHDLLGLTVAVLSYVIAVSLRIDLEVGDLALGAAFAPALVVLSKMSTTWEVSAFAVACVLGGVLGGLRRRGQNVALRDALALSACTAVTHGADVAVRAAHLGTSDPMLALIAGTGGVLVYSLVADRRRHLKIGVDPEDRRVWLWLQAVLVSAYGLMILGYAQIGWPALLAMLVVLGPTKSEFDRYAMARRVLRQTIGALGELERASLL